jgi:hypothetical protein
VTIGRHYCYVSNEAGTSFSLDFSCLVSEVSINHGRSDTDSPPEPATATLEMAFIGDSLPDLLEIGTVIQIRTVSATSVARIRFMGRITDITLGWEDAGEATPEHGIGQIIATSFMADLGRRVVGAAPFPQELDGARVDRVMTLAGYGPLDPITSDPGTVQIIPRDIDASDALSVIRGTAESAGGMLWEWASGTLLYADSNHRRATVSTVTIDACHILVTPAWSRTTQGLINSVSIGYGAPPVDGSEQPQWAANNAASITRYGEYAFSATTELAALADAQAMAGLLLARNAEPVWIMAALPVSISELTNAETAAILNLHVNDLLTVTGLPEIASTAPTTASLWIEGWTERLAWETHDLTYTVSGYCRTAPAPRWIDVNPPETTWSQMGETTWADAACLGPTENLGRWSDVPATERWATVPVTTTWANYTGS